jgi:protein-S-isoprenylcysteine O-methyltransferase Ste14
VVALLSGIWMMWRSHADLGTNWSAGLQTSDAQSLVTTGVYARVRHPMYTAHWLLGIGQALLVHNWLAGAAGLVVFGLMYAVRVPREEAMMVDRFGAAYQLYQRKTGRVLPWF